MNKKKFIPSVNFHLWEPCNMKCKFCFATFQDVKNTILPKGHLPKADAINIIRQLAELGFQKISFAGGEPTLCPWLSDLIEVAKSYNMTTMLITNGSNLSYEFLCKNKSSLDWIALSVDSLKAETNRLEGRASANGETLSNQEYYNLIQNIKKEKYKLKINTVIHRYNYREDISDFILEANPERWKVMQVLPIKGQNDKYIAAMEITHKQFNEFVNRHSHIKQSIFEDNHAMTNSYVMIDPAGRFFDNTKKKHTYSAPILDVGAEKALNQMNYNFEDFLLRGGQYEW